MGTKTTPGEFDCYAKAEFDEPIFTILARDPVGASTVQQWAAMREEAIADGVIPDTDRERAKIREARLCSHQMMNWLAARAKSDV